MFRDKFIKFEPNDCYINIDHIVCVSKYSDTRTNVYTTDSDEPSTFDGTIDEFFNLVEKQLKSKSFTKKVEKILE